MLPHDKAPRPDLLSTSPALLLLLMTMIAILPEVAEAAAKLSPSSSSFYDMMLLFYNTALQGLQDIIMLLPVSSMLLSVYIQLIIVSLASVRYPKLAFTYVLILLLVIITIPALVLLTVSLPECCYNIQVPWMAPTDALSTAERIFMFFHLYCCEIWRYVDYAFDGIKTADSPATTDCSTKTADGIDMERFPMDRIVIILFIIISIIRLLSSLSSVQQLCCIFIQVHMLTYQGVTKRTERVPTLTFDSESLMNCIGHSIVSYSIYNHIASSIFITLSPYIGISVGKYIAAMALAVASVNLFTAISDGMDFTFKLIGYRLEPYCQNFWIADEVGVFWRLWNTPFQRVLYRHVYHPLYHVLGFSKNFASLATFIVSSAAHWIPFTSFLPAVNRYESFISWNVFFISQYMVCGIESFLKWRQPSSRCIQMSKRDPAMANALRWFFASMPSGLHHALTLFWVGLSATAVHVPVFNYFYQYTYNQMYH